MESEKVKDIKEGLECLSGHKPCNLCSYHELAEMQETCCINVVAEEVIDYINELESENEKLKQHKRELEGGQQDLVKLVKRLNNDIAELEKEIAKNANCLKQFAERLKEKADRSIMNSDGEIVYVDYDFVITNDIDETLKEFIRGRARK